MLGPARMLLKRQPAAPDVSLEPIERSLAGEGESRYLACARCLIQITTPGAGIAVAGSHEHTFDNPEGRRFRIGCFASVTGCAAIGPRSSYWTWFPGHTWQVVLCGSCRVQLGWLFRSSERRFHGLILDRLVERVADAGSGERPS